jgi:uncharacterized RDD family membrane protein YckC
MVTPSNNSFAPPKSVVADVIEAEDGAQLASRSTRLGASIIDGVLLSLPFVPCYVLAFSSIAATGQQRPPPGGIPSAMVLTAMARTGGWFYGALALSLCIGIITAVLIHRHGQTIGKKWLGIKEVRKDGSRVTLARVFFLRYLLNTLFALIPIVGGFYGLIDVLLIFGKARRCGHDYLADTIVVRA